MQSCRNYIGDSFKETTDELKRFKFKPLINIDKLHVNIADKQYAD